VVCLHIIIYIIILKKEKIKEGGEKMKERGYEVIVRVIGVGYSIGVTIPKYILEELGIQKGDHVRVLFSKVSGETVRRIIKQKVK
jgi:hypothetical protein